jgi:uncharacterized membrane protein
MDMIFALLGLALFFAVLAFPFWVIVKIRRVSRLEARVRELDDRIDTLSGHTTLLRKQMDDYRSAAGLAVQPFVEPVRSAPAPVAAEVARTASTKPVTVAAPPVQAPIALRPLPRDADPVSAPQPERVAARPVRKAGAATPQLDSSIGLEERLGTNWLNKLGALLLVVGVVFFMTYQLRNLGPLGKDIVGLIAGAVLLVGGVVAERRTEYRMFSRGVMAAGWALIFFTTFALYHIPAARVLDSQVADLVLMLVVAGAMVAHALRYQSQVVTGLAFLFAFATVAISHDTAFTLSAGAILAIASAAIAVRMRWFPLEVGAIAATYFNHFLWLPILASSTPDLAAARFQTSLALLAVYWLTFRASFIARRDVTPEDEGWSAMGAVLNTAGLMVVSSQYSLNPGLVFSALIALGAADALFAQLVRTRRMAFIAGAFPARFGPRTVSLAWLIEAEALVVIGVRARDGLFTRLGVMASALAGVHVFAGDVMPLLDARNGVGPHPGDPAVGSILIAAAVIYYINSLRVLPSRPDVFPLDFERVLADKLSYAGAAALIGAAWAFLPGPWLSPVLLAIALGVLWLAKRLASEDLWMQGQGAAFLGVVTLAAVNFDDPAMLGMMHRRIVVVLLVAVAEHALYWLSRQDTTKADHASGAAHSWIGSALIATLAWYEFQPLAVVLVWSALAVLALEAGVRWNRRDLRLQAFTALALAFGRIFVVNLNGSSGLLGSAAVTTAPLVLVLFYVYERIADDETTRERRRLPELIAACGTVALGAMLRVAVAPSLVAISWSALVLLLAVISALTMRRLFMRQAVVGTMAVCGQAAAINIYGASYFTEWWTGPWFSVGASVALVLAALPIARRTGLGGRWRDASGNLTDTLEFLVYRRPDQVLFFAPLGLLVWLSAVHATGFVTMAWGIEAVSAFMLALWMRERSFRLGALALLLASVLRISLVDVWQLDQQGRYIAFIALGLALLLVSFLYSKYHELLKEYL